MHMRPLRLTFLWMTCCMALATRAQQAVSAEELVAVAKEMKAMHSYGYDYRIELTAPNGQYSELSGKAFGDASAGIMYNTNSAQTILLTPEWYYRADHPDRGLPLIDLSKHYNDQHKHQFREDLFNNTMLSYYLDSFVM